MKTNKDLMMIVQEGVIMSEKHNIQITFSTEDSDRFFITSIEMCSDEICSEDFDEFCRLLKSKFEELRIK